MAAMVSGKSPGILLGYFPFWLLCAVGVALASARAGASDKPYEFGVLPYLPPTKLQELYGPIAADFEAKLGRPIVLGSKTDYTLFRAALSKETYDIAFVQPFDYVNAHDKHGYLPVARRVENLEALIVVRSDSPLKSIKDLRGKTVANPAVDAVVSHLTTRALEEAGIHPTRDVKREYGRNQFTCMHTVLIGAADACGTADQALLQFEKAKHAKNPFRVLHRTKSSPPPLFVVHKRVPKKDRDLLLKTILGWPTTEEGQAILADGRFIPFTVATDAEYESVRRYVGAKK